MLLLLLAVCGNTANLVLARASARQREMGVRLALGAGPWRIASLLLTENVLLALAGAALGACDRRRGARRRCAMLPLVRAADPVPDERRRVGLAFAMALGVACGLVFGAAPALQLARLDPQLALRAGAQDRRRAAGCATR